MSRFIFQHGENPRPDLLPSNPTRGEMGALHGIRGESADAKKAEGQKAIDEATKTTEKVKIIPLDQFIRDANSFAERWKNHPRYPDIQEKVNNAIAAAKVADMGTKKVPKSAQDNLTAELTAIVQSVSNWDDYQRGTTTDSATRSAESASATASSSGRGEKPASAPTLASERKETTNAAIARMRNFAAGKDPNLLNRVFKLSETQKPFTDLLKEKNTAAEVARIVRTRQEKLLEEYTAAKAKTNDVSKSTTARFEAVPRFLDLVKAGRFTDGELGPITYGAIEASQSWKDRLAAEKEPATTVDSVLATLKADALPPATNLPEVQADYKDAYTQIQAKIKNGQYPFAKQIVEDIYAKANTDKAAYIRLEGKTVLMTGWEGRGREKVDVSYIDQNGRAQMQEVMVPSWNGNDRIPSAIEKGSIDEYHYVRIRAAEQRLIAQAQSDEVNSNQTANKAKYETAQLRCTIPATVALTYRTAANQELVLHRGNATIENVAITRQVDNQYEIITQSGVLAYVPVKEINKQTVHLKDEKAAGAA